jgi:hypothetical protein
MTFADTWNQALGEIADDGQDWAPTEGDYVVKITKAKTEMTKGGTELAKLRLRIVKGDHAGDGFDHPLFFSSDFATKTSVIALRGYGLDVAKVKGFDDLDQEIGTLVGTEADIAVAWEGTYLRVTVNAARPPERPPPADGAKADDDIPF